MTHMFQRPAMNSLHSAAWGKQFVLQLRWIKKQTDMKPAGQPEQAGCGSLPKSHVLHMLVRKFLCDVNDTRVLIGLCLLVMSH